jgi:hypothetical protein
MVEYFTSNVSVKSDFTNNSMLASGYAIKNYLHQIYFVTALQKTFINLVMGQNNKKSINQKKQNL